MNLRDPARVDALAAQYVLGTLAGRARRRFEREARENPIVAAALRRWEERLLPFAEAVSPIAPPARVWTAILARLGASVPSPEPRRAPRGAGSAWWRWVAIAGLATSLALAIALFKPAPERPEGTLVVVLAGQDAKPAIIATAARTGRVLTLKAIGPLTVAPDRGLELWMLPESGNPRSLGLVTALPPANVARVTLPATADQALQNIPALAISLEPAGGSPTGLPTGPVLYSGPVQRLY
jgi:anti-sigma-K factor RskA